MTLVDAFLLVAFVVASVVAGYAFTDRERQRRRASAAEHDRDGAWSNANHWTRYARGLENEVAALKGGTPGRHGTAPTGQTQRFAAPEPITEPIPAVSGADTAEQAT